MFLFACLVFNSHQIINQVSDCFDPAQESASPSSAASSGINGSSVSSFIRRQVRQSSGVFKQPALGLVWANCINTRIMLTRSQHSIVVSVSSLPPSAVSPSRYPAISVSPPPLLSSNPSPSPTERQQIVVSKSTSDPTSTTSETNPDLDGDLEAEMSRIWDALDSGLAVC